MKKKISIPIKQYKKLSGLERLRKISALIFLVNGKYVLVPLNSKIQAVLIGENKNDLIVCPVK